MEVTDIELLDRICRNDDAHAFQALYLRYWERLYVDAFHKVHSREDASDLVQDLFVALWEKRGTLQVQTTLATYLHAALKNRILNYFKHQAVRDKHIPGVSDAFRVEPETACEAVIRRELHVNIDEEITSMPDKMRRVFLLSRNNELTANQIASKLSISEQTVRNHITAALKRLRCRLQHR
ncbi:RNA polymerase sigma-70 factor [Chitinophaga barathri]|uniref:RNA polymerase sigma-70 factor n=1 Tax=Chitinophaga barathri TaxID=1647451 RepID=UPI0013C45312|nr:RNA polymerase sigma-70 factor [Chitinophaga barathri]